jgi:hypothetical protein
MKPRRFKLIKEYPGVKNKRIKNIIKTIEDDPELCCIDIQGSIYGDIYGNANNKYSLDYFLSLNEYWQEIKPILVTEDGIEMFEDQKCFFVIPDINNPSLAYKAYIHIIGKNSVQNDEIKYFKNQENAEKWIEENKPKWNDSDVKEFNSYINENELWNDEMAFNEWKRKKINDN